jgi:class 3 adenylate cyclase
MVGEYYVSGDGLKALFGAPLSREDDAERAVRAALAMLEACREYSQEVETRWGLKGFNIRVGLHSGRVLLGGGVEAEKTAMGIPINLAARMESSAPPGGLRISSETYRLYGLFDVDEQEPILVRQRCHANLSGAG